jgi:hypothetical protein
MKYRILGITILTLALLCIGVGASNAAEVEQHTYVSKTIVDVPWGEAPEEFGLSKGPPRNGARTFTLDIEGNIYIYDHVKKYIKEYDKAGNFKGNRGPITLGSSIAVGTNGHIFVLSGGNVDEYLKNGKLLTTHKTFGGGNIKFDKWDNLHTSGGYRVYTIGRIIGGRFEALSEEEQRTSEIRGYPSNRKDRRLDTKVKPRNNGFAELQILDDAGNILKRIPMFTSVYFGGVEVVKQDKDNFLYVRAERVDADDYAHLEVRKIDENGNLVSIVEMPNLYYTFPRKRIEVDEDGNMYHLFTTPKGVQIIKWEQE